MRARPRSFQSAFDIISYAICHIFQMAYGTFPDCLLKRGLISVHQHCLRADLAVDNQHGRHAAIETHDHAVEFRSTVPGTREITTLPPGVSAVGHHSVVAESQTMLLQLIDLRIG